MFYEVTFRDYRGIRVVTYKPPGGVIDTSPMLVKLLTYQGVYVFITFF
jgi:hypothetical protein